METLVGAVAMAVVGIGIGMAWVAYQRRGPALPGLELVTPTGDASTLPPPPPPPTASMRIVVDVAPTIADQRKLTWQFRRGVQPGRRQWRLYAGMGAAFVLWLIAINLHAAAAFVTVCAILVNYVASYAGVSALGRANLAGRFIADASGCRFERPGVTTTWTWEHLSRVADLRDQTILLFDRLSAVVIPKAAFTDPTDAARLITLIRSHRPDLLG